MGPVSRKASGRTPGRKGLEVSGRAAWTGRASSLGPPHAGQLPCLSELGNPRHFLAHAGVGEEGRRLLLSRPHAGGAWPTGGEGGRVRGQCRAHLGPRRPQPPCPGSRTSRPAGCGEGARVRDPRAENPLLCGQEPRGPQSRSTHRRPGCLCLSRTPPRPASHSRTLEGDRGCPDLPGAMPT